MSLRLKFWWFYNFNKKVTYLYEYKLASNSVPLSAIAQYIRAYNSISLTPPFTEWLHCLSLYPVLVLWLLVRQVSIFVTNSVIMLIMHIDIQPIVSLINRIICAFLYTHQTFAKTAILKRVLLHYPWSISRSKAILVGLLIFFVLISHCIVPKRINCPFPYAHLLITVTHCVLALYICSQRLIWFQSVQFTRTDMFRRHSNPMNFGSHYFFHFLLCWKLQLPISSACEFYHYLSCRFQSF